MFLIDREEATEIRKRFPYVAIYITSRQAPGKRKKYYTEERTEVLTFIDDWRTRNVIEHFDSRGETHIEIRKQ